MITYTVPIRTGACLLVEFNRVDGEVERITGAANDVTIGGVTWKANRGFRPGNLTRRNDGTPPTFGFEASLTRAAGGPLRFRDVHREKYLNADVLIELSNALQPTFRDFVFRGNVLGDLEYDKYGRVRFELLSRFAVPRDILVGTFTLMCGFSFGDPLTCGVPVFPYSLGGDLSDVARNAAITIGERRRFRFAAGGTPEDCADVYLEALTTGVTAGGVPGFSATVGATTVDGGVTWVTRNAWARAVRISAASDQRTLLLDRDPDPRAVGDNAFYHPASLWFVTGEHAGRRFKGGNWNAAARTIQTYMPCSFAAVDDWAYIAPDCDKTYAMCHGKFANARRHGGFPKYEGAKAQAQQMALAGVE